MHGRAKHHAEHEAAEFAAALPTAQRRVVELDAALQAAEEKQLTLAQSPRLELCFRKVQSESALCGSELYFGHLLENYSLLDCF